VGQTVYPTKCTPGYICTQNKLSKPDKSCNPGYYCLEGTTTDNITAIEKTRPYPCPIGTFCPIAIGQLKPSTTQGSPTLCPYGTFNNETNASICKPCIQGY